MSGFNLEKFRTVFLKSDGWQVSDCYKTYDDKFLRKDAHDAYEGAKWAWQEQQAKIDLIEKEIVETQEFLNKQNRIKQAEIDDLKKIIKMQECGVDAIKKTLNEIYDACDEDETVAMLLDKIQELLK